MFRRLIAIAALSAASLSSAAELDLQLHYRILPVTDVQRVEADDKFSLATDPLTWAAMTALIVDWGTTIDMSKRNGAKKRAYDLVDAQLREVNRTSGIQFVQRPIQYDYHEGNWYTARFIGRDVPHQHRIHQYFATTAAISLASRALLPKEYSWIPMSIQLGVNAHAGRKNISSLHLNVTF